jgi:hypothetical protein
MILEIQSQDHIELYASDAGYCCILQKSYEGEDALILIAPHMVDDVCEMLQKVKVVAEKNRKDYIHGKESK